MCETVASKRIREADNCGTDIHMKLRQIYACENVGSNSMRRGDVCEDVASTI